MLQTLHHGRHCGPDREGLLLPDQCSEPASPPHALHLHASPHLPDLSGRRGVALVGLGETERVSGSPELQPGLGLGAPDVRASRPVRFAYSQG